VLIITGGRLLSPETAAELQKLANSPISDMNFTRFTNIIEDEITKVRTSSRLFLLPSIVFV
jgi:hypothetical protein